MSVSEIIAHKGTRWIALGWSGFIAENLILSHNRDWLIDQFGDTAYHGSYSALSTLACASVAYGYFRHGRNQGPKLWNPDTYRLVSQASAFTFQTLGLVGFSQLLPKLQIPVSFGGPNDVVPVNIDPGSTTRIKARCPIDFSPQDVPQDGIYGLKRVTRHPTFWSLGFLALGSAVTTPFVSEVVCFTFPIIFAFIGGMHQDYRHRRGSGGVLTNEVDAVTCSVPFVSLVTGTQSWTKLLCEVKQTNAIGGVITSVILAGIRLRRR